MTQIMNAFHPDYIKTYHPNFLTDLRIESRQTKNGQNMTNHVNKMRKTNPSHGTLFGISDKVLSVTVPAHMSRPSAVNLDVRDFHIYQKAGMPKKTQSQIMSEVVAKKRQTNKNWGTALGNSKNIPKNIPKNG